jgi:hypothetical protein
MLVGCLLGDAHLETQNGRKPYRLCYTQSSRKALYVEYIYEMWAPLIRPRGRIERVYSNGKKTIGFRTQSSHLFVPYAKAFYTFGVKHVPQCLGE